MSRIVLAYSGGLDTSVAIPWLVEHLGAEVVTVTLDLGQGKELEHVRARAIGAGAARCHVLDCRDEFAREYILPALQAGALTKGTIRSHPRWRGRSSRAGSSRSRGWRAHPPLPTGEPRRATTR